MLFGLLVQIPLVAAPAWWLWVGLLGLLHGFAQLIFLQALWHGPIAVVGAISAMHGAATVLLAVLVLGERPAPLDWIAVGLATLGAAFSVAGGRIHSPWRQGVGLGPIYAALTVVVSAVYVIGLPLAIRTGGWVLTVLVSRLVSTVIIWAMLLFLMSGTVRIATSILSTPPTVGAGDSQFPYVGFIRALSRGPVTRDAITVVVTAGVLNTVGQLSRGAGLALAPAWIVGLLSSMSPAVVIAAGVVTGDRLSALQWSGVAMLGSSVLMLGLIK
jgi:drug/metabolite transporter (DMT)-like permease